MAEQRCKHCGSTRYGSSRHIQYGADLDNPVKHFFEPDEGLNELDSLRALNQQLVEAGGNLVKAISKTVKVCELHTPLRSPMCPRCQLWARKEELEAALDAAKAKPPVEGR